MKKNLFSVCSHLQEDATEGLLFRAFREWHTTWNTGGIILFVMMWKLWRLCIIVSLQRGMQAPPATRKMLKGLISRYWVFGNKSNANILKSLISDEGCEQGCVLYKELDPEDYSSVSIRDLVWLLCCDAAFFPRHKRCGSTSCSRCSSTSQRDHRLRSHVWGNSHLWRKLVGDVAGFKLFSSDVVDWIDDYSSKPSKKMCMPL